MAVLMTLEAPGGTTAQYDRANAVMGIAEAGDLPPGLVVHTCAVTDDGIEVVDVWDSVSALDDFAHNRLSAAFKEAGLAGATPRISPVHQLLFGTGKEANVLVLLNAAGVTTDDFDALVARIPFYADGGRNHPSVMSVAAFDPDGVRIAGLWDSEAAYQEFARSQLFPAIQSLRYFVLRVWPVYNHLRAHPGTDG
jgi:hypothetical protein